MVLESLIKATTVIKKPWHLFFYGLFVASLGLFFAFWIFRDQADLVMVSLTTFACIPLLIKVIKKEEEADIKLASEKSILKRHSRVLCSYLFLFLGITIAFVVWFVIVEENIVLLLFNQQINTIEQINSPTGHMVSNAVSTFAFGKILVNNMKVLIFCIIFAFFYGAGAIFVLTWNASVVAVAIGSLIRLGLTSYIQYEGGLTVLGVASIISQSFMRYFIHGIPEMFAYMVAGLAGGILSVAVINQHLTADKLKKILLDAGILFLAAVILTVLSAVIEVYVSAAIF